MPQQAQLAQSPYEARRELLKISEFEKKVKEVLAALIDRYPSAEAKVKEELLFDLNHAFTSIPWQDSSGRRRSLRAFVIAGNPDIWQPKVDPQDFVRSVDPLLDVPQHIDEAMAEIKESAYQCRLDWKTAFKSLSAILKSRSGQTRETHPDFVEARHYSLDVRKRIDAIQELVGKSHRRPTDKEICNAWDLEGLVTPKGWNGVRWEEAYKDRIKRNRIHRIISPYVKHLGLCKTHQEG